MPQAQEPSHLSDQRAASSNKPVVDVPPEVTRNKSIFSVYSHSNKVDETESVVCVLLLAGNHGPVRGP